MLLTLVITLLLVWAAVIGSIYSNFLTFFSNFAETENYNKAYYASIAALERAELVIRQRKPWYVWSGWWKSELKNWNIKLFYTWSVDQSSDWIIGNFSYLSSGDSRWTDVFWSINSRTNQVPEPWDSNIDWMLITWDSSDYNMMDYETSATFLLYYDSSTWNPYASGTIVQSKPTSISWSIRLSPYLSGGFWWATLNTDKSLSVTWVKNDAIVDWQLIWTYNTGENQGPFTVYSYQDIAYSQEWNKDTAIREHDINVGLKLNFSNNYWDPIQNQRRVGTNNDGTVTIISPYESELSGLDNKFKELFNVWSDIKLRLSLLNLLRTSTTWIIYPFLEYQFDFWTGISDRYFRIDAEWKYDDFQVNTIIYRPTIKESILWDFTVIF